MAKKQNKAVGEVSPGKYTEVIGTPTLLLLPARNYKFHVFDNKYSIKLPRQGNLGELAPKFFDKTDEFDFLQFSDEENCFVFNFSNVSQTLFATAKYPDMKDGQAFIPMFMTVKEEEVEIVGKLIEMVKEGD